MSNNDTSKDDKKIAEFLGIRVLTPLEEESVGGAAQEHQHDNDVGTDHDHEYHTNPGQHTQ
jgi:hypothetical protein